MTVQLTPSEAKDKYGALWARDTARAGLWAAGRLGFLLHAGQKDLLAKFRAHESVIHVWNIGRRYGKSTGACVLAFETAIQIPRARIHYVASTYTSLRDFVIPTMEGIAGTAPEPLRPRIVADSVRFPNGSEILLSGCEDRLKANRLRGGYAHLVIVDEASFIAVLDYAVTEVLLPQVINTAGKILLCSTPPESPAHPFVRFAKKAEEEGSYHHRTVDDAPHLTHEQIERLAEPLGGRTSAKWRREFLAEFVIDPISALVPEFAEREKSIVVADDLDIPFHHDRYTVGDVGFVDLTAFLFADYDFQSATLYVHHEYFAEKATSEEILNSISGVEGRCWPGPLGPFAKHERYVDAQAITRADLGKYHHYTQVSTKEPEAAINSLRLAMASGKIKIHERCNNLISHLRHGVWNSARTSFERSEGLGHFDGVAALMYLNRHCDFNHNPFPPDWRDPAVQYVPSALRTPYFRSEAHRQREALAKIFRPKRKRA